MVKGSGCLRAETETRKSNEANGCLLEETVKSIEKTSTSEKRFEHHLVSLLVLSTATEETEGIAAVTAAQSGRWIGKRSGYENASAVCHLRDVAACLWPRNEKTLFSDDANLLHRLLHQPSKENRLSFVDVNGHLRRLLHLQQ